MIQSVVEQLLNPNTQWVLIGTLLLGIASGVLGSFTLLRKQSLIGDAMAHAALPGVCFGFMLSGSKSIIWLLLGAAITGLIAAWFIQITINHSKVKEDSALGLVLSVFFGFGIVLLTFIQHSYGGNQSGLSDFIFGQAASMVGADVQVIITIAVVLLLITFIFFKEFKLITFDPQFAKGIGLQTTFFNGLLMVLVVSAVVIGLQTVGVVLMAAMLITPAISARYWTEKLSAMIIISGVIGGISGVLGTLLSTTAKGMATGPLIIVAATSMFLISLVFAPNRGLLAKLFKQLSVRKRTARNQLLLNFYELSELGDNAGFTAEQLMSKRKLSYSMSLSMLQQFEKKAWVYKTSDEKWKLTDAGLEKAYEIVLNERLFEMYLMHEMELAQLQLKSRDDIDLKKLPAEIKEYLFKLLNTHQRTPRLLPKSARVDERGIANGL
ncbi:metal ABC transporter permease [Metabacillus fastidiosus]|uniref:Metal ABC transporter permease n=1 Tax=Metabacillus fastidiosus TaxID=1458 RepID=A0ABU6NW01_9BACI|nr:metal ABC transporter permease [Metabacillus fastidiosus]MED4401302.1 metal ABC transporter permease [Metabacillus fastidiosus]MED4464229.1 metal ABC transporter permease [Metabacillus fastidiosus]